MNAVVMCGGRGTRLETDREKPLVDVGGRAMVLRVVDAVAACDRLEAVYAAVSPKTPETRARLTAYDAACDLRVVDTPGEGYVADLDRALAAAGRPAVTVAADLPLLAPSHVERLLGVSGPDPDRSRTVCVPADLKRRLGVSVDTSFTHGGRAVAPTGLNLVAGESDEVMVWGERRLAVNVNRPRDRRVAEEEL